MTADVTLFREAIAADQACIEAVRSALEYRPLTASEERHVALLEERMGLDTAAMLKLLEATS